MNHSKSILFTMMMGVSALGFAQEPQHAQHGQHGQKEQQRPHADHSNMSHAMASSPGAAKAPYDAQFLDTMSAHHKGAIEMAMLVPERAQHAELKDKARAMIDMQNKEIHQLQTLKKEWYPNQKEAVNLRLPGMKAMDMKHMEMLSADKGHKFDLHFLDMMIKHHGSGITMAQNALKRAKHAEVKDLARKIIADQKKEQAEMKKWHKEWSAGHH